MNNIKTNENEKLIEKPVGLVEKLNERVLTLEKKSAPPWTNFIVEKVHCTDAQEATNHLENLENKLVERKYPKELVKKHIDRAKTTGENKFTRRK